MVAWLCDSTSMALAYCDAAWEKPWKRNFQRF